MRHYGRSPSALIECDFAGYAVDGCRSREGNTERSQRFDRRVHTAPESVSIERSGTSRTDCYPRKLVSPDCRSGTMCQIRTCVVPGCEGVAELGEDWATSAELQPILSYNQGIEMAPTVRDLAVGLTVCEEHGSELSTAGWQPIVELLDSWGWRPQPSSNIDLPLPIRTPGFSGTIRR